MSMTPRLFPGARGPAPRPVGAIKPSGQATALPQIAQPRPAAQFGRPSPLMRPKPSALVPGGILNSARDASEDVFEDIFRKFGLRRIDNEPHPKAVSADVWADVFPPDRKRVHEIAALKFVRGANPDDAVRQAQHEIDAEIWKTQPLSGIRDRLVAVFPGSSVDSLGVPSPPVANAARSVTSTAKRAWREILESSDPARTAFIQRTWSAPKGKCLVCCEMTADSDPKFQSVEHPSSPDRIHETCKPAMRHIGPVFGELVLAAARKAKEDYKPNENKEPLQVGDPDDWSSYAI